MTHYFCSSLTHNKYLFGCPLSGRDILNYFMRKSLAIFKLQPNLIGNNEQHPNNFIQDNFELCHWAVED
jgi:hypothetical protein